MAAVAVLGTRAMISESLCAEEPSVRDLGMAWTAIQDEISGIRYKGKIDSELAPEFLRKNPDTPKDYAHLIKRVEFATSADMVNAEVSEEDISHHVSSYRASFDGLRMQTLDRRTGVLILSAGTEFLPFFNGQEILFRPFLIDKNNGDPLKAQPIAFGELTKRVTESYAHGLDRVTTAKGYDYRFHPRPEFGPLAMDFECRNKAGIVVATYHVVDAAEYRLPSNKTIKLPRKVVIQLSDNDGTPIRTDTLEVEEVALGATVPKSDTQISPGLANYIWDRDRNVWIKMHH